MRDAMKGQYMPQESSPVGYRSNDDIKQMTVDCAAMLRRLIQMRGNAPAESEDSYQRYQLLTNKIIEIQGLLAL